jgi:WD40 repeat protein
VLCDLEGLTHVEAARLLGWRVGTVKSRQARARARLRDRLARRGLAPSVGVFGAVLEGEAALAPLPRTLSVATARAAAEIAVTGLSVAATAGVASARVVGRVRRWEAVAAMSGAASAAGIVLAGGLIATAATLLLARQPGPASVLPSAPRSAFAGHESGVNADVDPTPAGAVTRIGRQRFSHGDAVTAVAWQPNGTLIASAGMSIVKLWDGATGRIVRELPSHAHWWQSLAFSPDGSRLASGGDDWTIRVWDVATGRVIRVIHSWRHGSGTLLPFPVAFGADGKTVLGGCLDGRIIVWDLGTGLESSELETPPELVQNRPGDRFSCRVAALAISPAGDTLAALFREPGRVRLWDLKTRRLVGTIPTESLDFSCLAFSPDGKTLAWYGRSTEPGADRWGIRLWDLSAGRFRGQLAADRQRQIAFSPDGRRLASTGPDWGVMLWDLETGQPRKTMKGHIDWTTSLVFSPDSATVVTGSRDGSIRSWDTATGQERFGGPLEHWGRAQSAVVAANGRSIVIASSDRIIRTVDLLTGALERSLSVEGKEQSAAALAPDSGRAAVANHATVDLYDLANGRRIWSQAEFQPRPEMPEINGTDTSSLVFSRDGGRLVSLTLDLHNGNRQRATIRVWDAASGRLVSQIVRNGYVEWTSALLEPGRILVLSGRSDQMPGPAGSLEKNFLAFYDTETGRPLREYTASKGYGDALAAAPDGSWLATAYGNWVHIWNAATGELSFTLRGPRYGYWIARLAVSPDGTRVAAVEQLDGRHDSGNVHIWRFADGLRTHELPAQATALAFAPDGKNLVTGGRDGTALVWDLSSPATAPARRPPPDDREIVERWATLARVLAPDLGNEEIVVRIQSLADGGDRTVEFLARRLLDPQIVRADDAEIDRLAAPLADPVPATRLRAAARLEEYGAWPEMTLANVAEGPAPAATLENVRRILRDLFRERRESSVYRVLRQIGSLRARWLLHRLADTLPDDAENNERKRCARETAAELDAARLRMPPVFEEAAEK